MNIGSFVNAVPGGVLIGQAASFLPLLQARIFGISGILTGVFVPKSGDTTWRLAALVGLVCSGFLLLILNLGALVIKTSGPLWRYAMHEFIEFRKKRDKTLSAPRLLSVSRARIKWGALSQSSNIHGQISQMRVNLHLLCDVSEALGCC
ncbi:MAG: hypothetical protein NTV34_07960 [Proteobacteria bacterium]|nr:hypothetical protein [Pseudomonadota bacterium]